MKLMKLYVNSEEIDSAKKKNLKNLKYAYFIRIK